MQKVFLNWTISLLTGLFLLFIFTIVGFVLNISINGFYFWTSVVITIGLIIYLTFKDNNFSFKNIFAQLIVLFNYIFICGLICYLLPDISWDGTTYHQASIISLKLGLNPIYDNVENFMRSQKYVFESSIVYVENFLKFVEIIGANIYYCFEKIELTKIVNFIFLLIAFCYSCYSFKNFGFTTFKSIIFSIVFTYNPVCIYQMLSNYVDGIFYYCFLIMLFAMINYIKGFDKLKSLYILMVSTVLFSNIKLTGLFTALILYLIFLVCYRSKELLKVFVISLALILFTGINPYFTNIAQHRNPFYPIVKESFFDANREFMKTSYPLGFENKNRFEKFLFSTFAVSKNLSPLIQSNDVPRLKVPFTLSGDDPFIFEDMRLGGFGYFFSGILLSSLLISIFLRFKNGEDKKIFWTIMAVLIISVLGNHEAWWARFVPQFWLVPLFIFSFLALNNKFKSKIGIVILGLLFLCFINSFIINIQYFSYISTKAFENKEFIKAMPNVLLVPYEYPKIYHKFETMPVKLAEYGIEVKYIDNADLN